MSVSSANEAKRRLRFILAKDRVSLGDRKPVSRDHALLWLDKLHPVMLKDMFPNVQEYVTADTSGKLIRFKKTTPFEIKEFNNE